MYNATKNLIDAEICLNSINSNNKYYLFNDEIIVCDKKQNIIKILHPPSDYKGPFAKHMLPSFHIMYYRKNCLAVVVGNRWNEEFLFELDENKLELSKDFHPYR
ncbi:MAG: hypothetical protein IJ566_02495 [Cardiobacteriaceae bacterium]|nr:hypothetical protein [Cardiobacteriaceae bacterium]